MAEDASYQQHQCVILVVICSLISQALSHTTTATANVWFCMPYTVGHPERRLQILYPLAAATTDTCH